jgi:hypothetical protein
MHEAQFLVMVNGEVSLSDIMRVLESDLPGIKRTKHKMVYEWSRNIIDVEENKDYDQNMINSEDGYLYYRYRINVFPIDDDQSIEHQVNIARDIRGLFASLSCITEVIATFSVD